MDTIAAVFVACLVILALYWVRQRSNSRTPPGPIGLPLVGYMPYMTDKPYQDFQKLSKIYGSIFSVRLGALNTIVLGDYESTKEAFAQDAFIGRPPESPFEVNKETIETDAFNGPPWIDQRRFSLHMLRDLGFGKSRMEENIQDEIMEFLRHVQETDGKPTRMCSILAPSVSNNIASLMFGKRRMFDDPIWKMLYRTVDDSAQKVSQVSWQMFFPWLQKTLKFLRIGEMDKLSQIFRDFRSYLLKEIDEHEETLDANNLRDYIDGYLMEIKKGKDPAFCKPVLQDMVFTFFGAGSETVRTTVEWLLLLAADMQHVQKKVQEEIYEVLGDKMPIYADHVKMPYCMAVVMELMRWRTIIPINPFRYTLADTELGGFFIPKHTYILANLWEIHHRSDYWGADAEDFKPERFLTEDGKSIRPSKYFIPFSIGKRSCPGEPMARVEVFLYFVCILQKFNLSLPEGKTADYEGELGMGLMPKTQEICFKMRH